MGMVVVTAVVGHRTQGAMGLPPSMAQRALEPGNTRQHFRREPDLPGEDLLHPPGGETDASGHATHRRGVAAHQAGGERHCGRSGCCQCQGMVLDGTMQQPQALLRALAIARVSEQRACDPQVIRRDHAIAKFMHRHSEECPGCPGVESNADDTEPPGWLDPNRSGELAGHLAPGLALDAGCTMPVDGVAGIKKQLDAAIGEDRCGGRGRVEAVTVQAPDALHKMSGGPAHGMLAVFHGVFAADTGTVWDRVMATCAR